MLQLGIRKNNNRGVDNGKKLLMNEQNKEEKFKVVFNFGSNESYYENDYGYKLVNFLNANDFYMLPNYPFKYSLDEMLLIEEDDIRDEVNEYCYYCLTNLEKVILVNI